MTKNREPLKLLAIYDQEGFTADLNCREAAYLNNIFERDTHYAALHCGS